MLRVGIAMLQGARHEHAEALRGAAAELGFDSFILNCATIPILRIAGNLRIEFAFFHSSSNSL